MLQQLRHWLKKTAIALAVLSGVLLAMLLVGLAVFFFWASSDGSLATALRWASERQPGLSASEVTGSLRQGGRVGSLVWQQGGLTVRAQGAQLQWQPLALLRKKIHLNNLQAERVEIDDQRPPDPQAATAPPTSLALPVQVEIDAFSIAAVRYTARKTGESPASPVEVSNIAGRYAYTGSEHQLKLDDAQAFDGRYSANIKLQGDVPFALDAQLSAERQTAVPGSETVLPLVLNATLRGPLAELFVEAQAQLQNAANAQSPQARVTARVLPWASQPLAQANATFAALDLAALGLGLPRSELTGSASVQPEAAATTAATSPPVPGSAAPSQPSPGGLLASRWNVLIDLQNRIPGPYDRQRLPLEQLAARLQWQGGSQVLVQELNAALGGGRLQASGEVVQGASISPVAPNASTAPPAPPAPDWNVKATLERINPALLLSTLAAWPLDGRADLQSRAGVISFDALVKTAVANIAAAAAAAKKAVPAAGSQSARNTATAGAAVSARSLARLGLQEASAKGSWSPQSGKSGSLRLATVQVRTSDALLTGEAIEIEPLSVLQTGGKGQLQLTAPGLQAQVDGEARPASGAGSVRLAIADMALALAWLQKIPGVPPALQSSLASGRAQLDARWKGGWNNNPTLDAQLAVPLLDLSLPASQAAKAGDSAAAGKTQVRNLRAGLSGNLQQATLNVQGQALLDQRRIDLQLALAGGQGSSPGAQRATDWSNLAATRWQATLRQFNLKLEDPALAQGVWQLATGAPLDIRWTPGRTVTEPGGVLEASAGQALLTPPASVSSTPSQTAAGAVAGVALSTNAAGAKVVARPPAQPAPSALIEWQPVRWQPGSLLTSAGRISGLPIGWIESLAGPQFAGSGLGGNLVFGGDWDARLAGDTLALKASLARTSGDLSLQATSAEGTSTRIAAGVRQARLDITSNGSAVSATVRWDSERAGTVDGQVSTRLERSTTSASANTNAGPDTQAGGWSWPATAPLTGQLQAQLPRIGVWSVLAPPGWRLRGSVAANIQVAGTRAAPLLSGTLQADDLALRSVVDGIEFGNGRLRSRLDGTRLLIDEFMLQGASSKDAAGKMIAGSGGQLMAKGQVAWVNGAPDVQLTTSISRLRASIRTDRQLTLSGNIDTSLKGKATQITGNLRVDTARILLPDEGTPQLGDDVVVRGINTVAGANAAGSASASIGSGKKGPEQASAPATAAPAATPAGPPSSLSLSVQLALGDDFRIEGKGIETRIGGALTITSNSFSQPPRLVGTVTTEGGIFRAYGQRLNIERGFLRFTGPVDNPSLDILAVRPVALTASDPQRVGVQVGGTALLPRVRLYAQPELPEAEKLSWLVLGRPAAGGGAEAALLQQAALALLGSKGGGTSGGLAASLGLDELSYKGASGGEGGLAGGAIVLGKRFSDNFYAAYESSISGATGTLFVFYDLTKRLTLRAQTGSQSAIDLIFTIPFD